jgi:hypothetical protein
MTEKTFIALADFIRANPEINTPLIVDKLAEFCGSQNDKFNTNTFLAYVNRATDN